MCKLIFFFFKLETSEELAMGKFRAKTKTGKNRQRWKKGQSSSSNPNKTKHRDAAKARLLRVGFGQTSEVPKGLCDRVKSFFLVDRYVALSFKLFL